MIDTLKLRDYISFLCFIVLCGTSPCFIYDIVKTDRRQD